VHDYTVPSGSSAHLDCLHVFYHAQLTVRNSRFQNCKHYGILLGSNGAGEAEHDLIENNFFGGAEVAGFGLRGGDGEDFDDVTVRYNSGGIITPQTTNGLHNVQWLANAASEIGSCRSGLTYRLNVVTTGGCGSTDRKADPAFVSASSGDFHIKAGSPAIDRGDPAAYPGSDIDGHGRFAGGAPDAGAHEFGASGPPKPSVSPPSSGPSAPARPPSGSTASSATQARPGTASALAESPLGRGLAADLAALGKRVRVSRTGILHVRLRCAAKRLPCHASISMRARLPGHRRTSTIARRVLGIRHGRTVAVRVRISSAARRALRRSGPIDAKVLVSLRITKHSAHTVRKDVRLLRAR
jgi:hypothetical protein